MIKNSPTLLLTNIVSFYLCMITICYANNELKDDIAKNISIHFCYDGDPDNFSLQALIRNKSNIDMKFSYLGTFHNYIYTLKPDGKVDNFIINLDTVENFKFEPEFLLKGGEWAVYKTTHNGNSPSPINSLKTHIESRTQPGKYQLWFDLVNWIDLSKGVYNKHTSNRLNFYVGSNGERVFVNDPDAVKAFQEIGIEVGNSSDKVEVLPTTGGNYRLREISNINRSGNAAQNQFELHFILAWIVGGILVLGLGYFIWKHSNQRNVNS